MSGAGATAADRPGPTRLADDPGVAAIEERGEIRVALGLRGSDLRAERVFVAGSLDGGEDPDRRREVRRPEARDQVRERRIGLVVYEQVGFGDAVLADRHDL